MPPSPSIEEKLNRLVPSGVSTRAQRGLEDTIDRLAAASGLGDGSGSPGVMAHWAWKAAAVVALIAAPVVMFRTLPGKTVESPALAAITPEAAAGLVVLSSTQQIVATEDDGLIIPEDGGTPHYRFRYQVSDEERLRDPETGTIVTLRQPRQEIHTIPVTLF